MFAGDDEPLTLNKQQCCEVFTPISRALPAPVSGREEDAVLAAFRRWAEHQERKHHGVAVFARMRTSA